MHSSPSSSYCNRYSSILITVLNIFRSLAHRDLWYPSLPLRDPRSLSQAMAAGNLDATTLVIDDSNVHYNISRAIFVTPQLIPEFRDSFAIAKSAAWNESLTVITESGVGFWQNITGSSLNQYAPTNVILIYSFVGYTHVAVFGSILPPRRDSWLHSLGQLHHRWKLYSSKRDILVACHHGLPSVRFWGARPKEAVQPDCRGRCISSCSVPVRLHPGIPFS